MAKGHRLISASHETTLEITKDSHITRRGSCIVAVRSEKGARDLSPEFKRLAKIQGSVITLYLECNGIVDTVNAQGSKDLTFTDPTDIVLRKSNYICGRTVAILSNKSARLLKRSLVEELRKENPVKVFLEVRC
ncbi:MAG: DUF371 domain-containing protein [Thermoproteota archaeon]